MTAAYSDPGIVVGIGEPEEDSRVGFWPGLTPFAAQDEVGVGAVGVPPETHPAAAGGDAVAEFESARAGLLPLACSRAREERGEAGVVGGLRRDLGEKRVRDRVDGAGFEVAIEEFGGFALELDAAVGEAGFAVGSGLLEAWVGEGEDDLAIEEMEGLVAPGDDLGGVPLPMGLLGIERGGDAFPRLDRVARGTGGTRGRISRPGFRPGRERPGDPEGRCCDLRRRSRHPRRSTTGRRPFP